MNRLYVVATWVPRRETIVVGALGPITLARGWHAYVGGARRGRDARVARHMRADKPLRWHADYLFTRYPATRSWLVDTPLSECELAARLRRSATNAADGVARFGASDCGCPGHLVSAPNLAALRGALAEVEAGGGRLRTIARQRRRP